MLRLLPPQRCALQRMNRMSGIHLQATDMAPRVARQTQTHSRSVTAAKCKHVPLTEGRSGVSFDAEVQSGQTSLAPRWESRSREVFRHQTRASKGLRHTRGATKHTAIHKIAVSRLQSSKGSSACYNGTGRCSRYATTYRRERWASTGTGQYPAIAGSHVNETMPTDASSQHTTTSRSTGIVVQYDRAIDEGRTLAGACERFAVALTQNCCSTERAPGKTNTAKRRSERQRGLQYTIYMSCFGQPMSCLIACFAFAAFTRTNLAL